MWNELVGTLTYQAGVSGTFTLPLGAKVTQIIVQGGGGAGSLTIFGGASIPLVANATWHAQENHQLMVPVPAASNLGTQDIVATGTASVYIEYTKPSGT